jgi:hypothetical protein
LPYTEEVKEKTDTAKLFKPYCGEYGKTITEIAKQIMEEAVKLE